MNIESYLQIKKMAKESGQSYKDFIVLSPNNDPFYAGRKSNKQKAEWFADLWVRFGFTDGVHLRRIFYQLLDKKDFLNANGVPLVNTKKEWTDFEDASKYARYLGLVSPDYFVDKRNPEGHFYFDGTESGGNPSYEIDDVYWNIPSWIPHFADEDFEFNCPTASINGYDYHDGDQKYHVEIWCEKSTMDDILLPLGREYSVNVITSVGFQSITRVIEMCKRVASIGKPVRIFYISDFDKAGDGMPVAVARQIEYWFHDYVPDADIKLESLVLTQEQVEKYKLPRIPIDEKKKGKKDWEDKHDEGAVELDALESNFPGKLKEIVEEAIAPYRDTELEQNLEGANDEAQDEVDTAIENVWSRYEDSLSEIAEQVKEISQRYEQEVKPIVERYETEIAPLEEKLESYKENIEIELNGINLNVVLPDRPEAECEVDEDEEDFLFDSNRSPEEQLEYYKRKQCK